jgi:hypothetical protein
MWSPLRPGHVLLTPGERTLGTEGWVGPRASPDTEARGKIIFASAGYQTSIAHVQSTDHELIPARNASLAAMQGSASGMFVTIQCENIRPSKEEMNRLLQCTMFAVRL